MQPLSLRGIVPSLSSILRSSYFRECGASWSRYLAHFNIMWGFIFLAITTACVAAGVYVFDQQTPYSLVNPIKWLGNLGAFILIVGSSQALVYRLLKPDDMGKGTYFDWLFLLVVFATGLTGLLTETLRLADLPGVAYPTYFIHLVFVWFLFAYLPFTKFAHLLYRSAAILYAVRIGRELKKGTAPSLPDSVQPNSSAIPEGG